MTNFKGTYVPEKNINTKNGWSKQQVLAWFGDRGVLLKSIQLVRWHWTDGILFYITGNRVHWTQGVNQTEKGQVDYAYTHRSDNSSIYIFEPYGSIPVNESPFANKEYNEMDWHEIVQDHNFAGEES